MEPTSRARLPQAEPATVNARLRLIRRPFSGKIMKKILHIFSFTGTATRQEWWLVYLSWWILLFVVSGIDSAITGNEEETGWLFTIVVLVSIWPLFATQIRRWHDRGKSGLWCLVNLIPFVGTFWAIIELGFFPSVGNDPWGSKNEYREPGNREVRATPAENLTE